MCGAKTYPEIVHEDLSNILNLNRLVFMSIKNEHIAVFNELPINTIYHLIVTFISIQKSVLDNRYDFAL